MFASVIAKTRSMLVECYTAAEDMALHRVIDCLECNMMPLDSDAKVWQLVDDRTLKGQIMNKSYAKLLATKVVVYTPAHLISAGSLGEAHVHNIVASAGGCTILRGGWGYYENKAGSVMSEEIAQVVVLYANDTSTRTGRVDEVISDFISYLKGAGEESVLVEATVTDPAAEETTWMAAIY